MNKTELVAVLAEKAEVSKKDAEKKAEENAVEVLLNSDKKKEDSSGDNEDSSNGNEDSSGGENIDVGEAYSDAISVYDALQIAKGLASGAGSSQSYCGPWNECARRPRLYSILS